MIQLYGFVRGLQSAPAGLDVVDAGGVSAVVGPREDDALAHALVLQELLDTADAVLPARFGERFADVAARAAAVAPQRDALQRRLDAVDGCVELGVRVARQSPPARPAVADGASYMRMRLRTVAAEEAAVDALHSALTARARAAVVAHAPTLLHDAGYLVERASVPEFAAGVDAYAADHPDLVVVCTGPWPPASFAGAA